ncbi:MAG: AlkZ family DNA glycosylase [Bacteroidetes bacterium]|nr:AlkZ family DNA glycosylase [Bacteroidota bacterium]
MTSQELLACRLQQQQISMHSCTTVGDVVRNMVAMQAQDYPGVRWSLGLRLPGFTEAEVDKALAARAFIRTWAFRGTLHLVSPEDIYTILPLAADRIKQLYARQFRELGLDDKTLLKIRKLFEKALAAGKQLTRGELAELLESKNEETRHHRLNFILQRLSLEGVICHAAKRDKEFTFALLQDWVGPGAAMPKEEALGQLAGRYIQSHGPATTADFAWWSGITLGDARRALESAGKDLVKETIGKETYWLMQNMKAPKPSGELYLLPGFDEYFIAYKNRDLILDPANKKPVMGAGNGILSSTIVHESRIIGTWKRSLIKQQVQIEIKPFDALSKTQHQKIKEKLKQYETFMQIPVLLKNP